MYITSISKQLVAASLSAGLVLALAACSNSAVSIAPTTAPAAAPTAVPIVATVEAEAAAVVSQPTTIVVEIPAVPAAEIVATAEALAAAVAAGQPTIPSVEIPAMPALPQPSAVDAASNGDGPCTLLTAAEVEKALGTLDGEPDGSGQDGNGAPACAYVARDGLLFVSTATGGSDAFAALMAEAEEQGAPLEPLSGLGDEAYVAAAAMEGMPGGDAVQGVLLVRAGDAILQLAIISSVSATDTSAALEQLAAQALTRLP